MNDHAFAYQLESKGKRYLALDDTVVRDTILKADCIESGTFVEVMLYALRQQAGLGYNEEIQSFSEKASGYLGKSLSNIPQEDKEHLLNEFCNLMEKLIQSANGSDA